MLKKFQKQIFFSKSEWDLLYLSYSLADHRLHQSLLKAFQPRNTTEDKGLKRNSTKNLCCSRKHLDNRAENCFRAKHSEEKTQATTDNEHFPPC
jgi:hypothetical protein